MIIPQLDDRLRINGRLPRSRIVTASGCRATTLETILWYSEYMPDIGIFTTKSIGPKPNPGNPAPIYCADPVEGDKARRNAVGLANPGIDNFVDELKWLRKRSYDLNGALLLGSAYGGNMDEIFAVCRAMSPYVDGIEINFSCPHAKGYGLDTGRDSEAMARIVNRICESFDPDVFVKLSPNLSDSDLAEAAKLCVEAGALGVTVINTVSPDAPVFPGTEIPVLFNGKGGGSGPQIKRRGLECVSIVREAVGPDPVIIGMGGIYTGQDIKDHVDAGADLVGIGTAMEGMDSRTLRRYFMRLNMDSGSSLVDNSSSLLPADVGLGYSGMLVSSIDDLSGGLRVLKLDGDMMRGPGQYLFLAVPGDGEHPTMEAPFSIPDTLPLTLAVRIYDAGGRKDHFTTRVKGLKEGDSVFVRGPYGVPLSIPRFDKVYLIGGGTGVAALASIAEFYTKNVAILGARSREELLFENAFKETHCAFGYVDEDGVKQGKFVHELLRDRFLKTNVHDGYAIICGPTPMMVACVEAAREKGFKEDKILVVTEPYMKCGVGICGSCSCHDGSISCTDGHIIPASKFMDAVKQKKVKRDRTGAWER